MQSFNGKKTSANSMNALQLLEKDPLRMKRQTKA